MKIAAIIAEYNPFHNGHKYQIDKIMEITDADKIVVIMSGNFMQRGEPAMMDKYTRTKACISCGADLVIELPFVYACGSAMDFAMGAVSLINSLGCIDFLCFGAETTDINLLDKISDIVINEPDDYRYALKSALSSGLSFPMSRQRAIELMLPALPEGVLSQPNNILAIEYICSLKRLSSNVAPVIIKRSNDYHSRQITSDIASASSIRSTVYSGGELSDISSTIPAAAMKLIESSYMVSWPVVCDDLTQYMQHSLDFIPQLSEICDITQDISNKIKQINTPMSFNELLDRLASKNYTRSRLGRCILHAIAGYTDSDREHFIKSGYIQYANILGFRKDSSSLIKEIKACAQIPLITKKADFYHIVDAFEGIDTDAALKMWKYDMYATKLYNQLIYNKFSTILPNDYNINLPIL